MPQPKIKSRHQNDIHGQRIPQDVEPPGMVIQAIQREVIGQRLFAAQVKRDPDRILDVADEEKPLVRVREIRPNPERTGQQKRQDHQTKKPPAFRTWRNGSDLVAEHRYSSPSSSESSSSASGVSC